MTDKQIIIDGVDISGCEFLNKTKHCKAQMSIICTDTNKCKCFSNCYYKQLKRKEQECEEFRKANDEKNELLIKLGCPTKATAKRKVFCLQGQLDKLKAENDLYKNAHKTEQDRRRSYENALAEIKEIAEECYYKCNSMNNCNISCNYYNDCNGEFSYLLAYLNKQISEVENDIS